MSNIDNIRNFAIIAHIDHGKSTIADRIIHSCGGLTEREMKAQVLDSMDIERERGITIKAQTVKLNYKAKDGKNYILNIIDTPGHVDFSYEVSRSLYACEGSILIVDSTQGVEAQTLANVYQALDINHEIIPVLNKVDLPASDLDRTKIQIEEVIGIDTEGAIPCSGKTGEGVEDILERIIKVLPSPKGESLGDLKCLLVDSWYDTYLGVVILVRVIDGKISKNMKIKMMSTNQEYVVEKVGVFTPKAKDINELNAGEIGFITTGIKVLSETKVGVVIADLARWQDWSVIEKLTAIYVEATPENIFVREPIVNYMKACPLPEAARALVKMREIDPEAVRRAATLAGLAGLTTVTEEDPSTEQPSTAPVRVADVVADDVTSDRSMVVSTGSQPVAKESQPGDRPILDSEDESATGSLLRWGFWLALVAIAAFLSRYLLQPGKRDAAG